MPNLSLSPKKLAKILRQRGFELVRQNGSHAIFRNFSNKKKVVVPMHSKDIPTGTLHAILKDAGIKL